MVRRSGALLGGGQSPCGVARDEGEWLARRPGAPNVATRAGHPAPATEPARPPYWRNHRCHAPFGAGGGSPSVRSNAICADEPVQLGGVRAARRPARAAEQPPQPTARPTDGVSPTPRTRRGTPSWPTSADIPCAARIASGLSRSPPSHAHPAARRKRRRATPRLLAENDVDVPSGPGRRNTRRAAPSRAKRCAAHRGRGHPSPLRHGPPARVDRAGQQMAAAFALTGPNSRGRGARATRPPDRPSPHAGGETAAGVAWRIRVAGTAGGSLTSCSRSSTAAPCWRWRRLSTWA